MLALLAFVPALVTRSGLSTAPACTRAASLSMSSSYPINVYIEDTDCYGVVFYANYIRFFERAAVAAIGASTISRLLRDEQLVFGLQSAHQMKYAMAATLGDLCDATLEPLGIDANGRMVAKASLVKDGKELWSAADMRFGFVSRATGEPLTDYWPVLSGGDWSAANLATAEAPDDPCAGDAAEPPAAGSSPTLEPTPPGGMVLQLDEAGAGGVLTLHGALCYFERHRTTYLGGPAGLQLLADAGVNVVVARVNGLKLFPAAHSHVAGAVLEVRCKPVLKARNTQVLFEQWLTTPEGVPLAKGEVACICLDAATNKMCAMPEAARASMDQWLL